MRAITITHRIGSDVWQVSDPSTGAELGSVYKLTGDSDANFGMISYRAFMADGSSGLGADFAELGAAQEYIAAQTAPAYECAQPEAHAPYRDQGFDCPCHPALIGATFYDADDQPVQTEEPKPCLCEHESHFGLGSELKAHDFARVPSVQNVKTQFGTYAVCAACASSGHMIDIAQPVMGQTESAEEHFSGIESEIAQLRSFFGTLGVQQTAERVNWALECDGWDAAQRAELIALWQAEYGDLPSEPDSMPAQAPSPEWAARPSMRRMARGEVLPE